MSEGNLTQSGAPQGAGQQPRGFQKGPKASRSLPDTGASPPAGPEWRQLSSTSVCVGGAPHTLKNPFSSSSCHRRPAPGPPRSIHNGPGRCSPSRLPPGSRRRICGAAQGPSCGTKAPQGCGPAPSPETAMHHGRGVEAARRRRRRRPPAARPPRAPPRAHAPSPQPRRLGLRRPSGGHLSAPKRARRRRRRTDSRRTHRCPPCSRRPAAGGRGDRRPGGGAQPGGAHPPREASPTPWPARAPRVGTHVR